MTDGADRYFFCLFETIFQDQTQQAVTNDQVQIEPKELLDSNEARVLVFKQNLTRLNCLCSIS